MESLQRPRPSINHTHAWVFAALRLSRTHCEDRGRKKNLTGVSLWFARAIADMHQLMHQLTCGTAPPDPDVAFKELFPFPMIPSETSKA